MRAVVISDTHVPRFARRFAEVLERVKAERPNLILHCGDFTSLQCVSALEAIAPIDGVAGNNDGPPLVARFGRRKIVVAEEVRLGLVHGDGVLGTTAGRARRAFPRDAADAILFGHSHVPSCTLTEGRWLINPGSPTDKRRQPRFSYAILDIDGRRLHPRLVFFEGDGP